MLPLKRTNKHHIFTPPHGTMAEGTFPPFTPFLSFALQVEQGIDSPCVCPTHHRRSITTSMTTPPSLIPRPSTVFPSTKGGHGPRHHGHGRCFLSSLLSSSFVDKSICVGCGHVVSDGMEISPSHATFAPFHPPTLPSSLPFHLKALPQSKATGTFSPHKCLDRPPPHPFPSITPHSTLCRRLREAGERPTKATTRGRESKTHQ